MNLDFSLFRFCGNEGANPTGTADWRDKRTKIWAIVSNGRQTVLEGKGDRTSVAHFGQRMRLNKLGMVLPLWGSDNLCTVSSVHAFWQKKEMLDSSCQFLVELLGPNGENYVV